jgi:hypothetical protein
LVGHHDSPKIILQRVDDPRCDSSRLARLA